MRLFNLSYILEVGFKTLSTMQSQRKALLLSSSNCHGYSLLEFAKEEICKFLSSNDVKELIFVPYAQNDFDGYTKKISDVINPWGFPVRGLHTFSNPIDGINSAKAIFIGGGNTFLLLSRLYEKKLVELIKDRVTSGNLLYIGSSAGTNVATKSIHTTNDMPIIYPPSFDAIAIVPFNINPHYIDYVENSTHKGETRDQRLAEYMEMAHANQVLGLREGSILHVNGISLILKGIAGAVVFKRNKDKTEYKVGADVSFLLEGN
ncbi:probable alpha-aspartyl dipeptidase [Pieris napi]|uniref:probable alpha-aspartyl dipeptidase n=1 Tax=Pieris napi TaxID=78633 RepID=UPI001FBA7D03|nr:probable alpha-aspartyl dipeptidase [Pieris napi]